MSNWGTVLFVTVVYALFLGCICSVRREGTARRVYRNSFVLYAIVLLLFKLLPEAGESEVRLVPLAGLFGAGPVGYRVIELILSALLFVPLGFLSGMHSLLKGERSACLKAVLLGAVISLVLELLQLFPLGKVFATDHILMNTIGAFFGFVFFALLSRTERMQRTLKSIL